MKYRPRWRKEVALMDAPAHIKVNPRRKLSDMRRLYAFWPGPSGAYSSLVPFEGNKMEESMVKTSTKFIVYNARYVIR